MTKTRIATHVLLLPPPPHATNALGRRHYTTSLTSPILALALAGCDKAVEPVADSTDTSDTDAPKGWLRRFIDKVTDFDEPSDYGIAGGVAIGTVAVVGAAAGGGDSATSSGGEASNPTPTNPTPTNTAPAFATDNATATADENATAVAYTPNATDPDSADTLTYSLKANTGDVALFSITSAGVLSFKTAPDYESPPSSKTSYSVTVIVSDGNSGTADAEQTVAITLNNVNEAPAFATDTATATAIAENSGAGQLVYTPTAATDTDAGDTIAYSLSGTDAGLFTIDSGTGAVTLTADPNYETKSSYAFTIVATDADGLTDELPVTLAITNVLPTATGTTAIFTVTGSVNASHKGVLTAKQTHDDPQGNSTFAYQWQRASTNSATDSDWANIGSATGTSYTPVDGTDTGKFLRLKITYTDSANNAHVIYDQITKGGGASDSGIIKHRAFSVTDDSTGNADIFTTDASTGDSNVMRGGDGDDTLIHFAPAQQTIKTLVGGNGNDLLIGGTGGESLFGDAGNDTLEGRAGGDRLDGGAGVDIMTGGTGNDNFVLELTNRAKDIVTDFTSGDDIEVDVTGGFSDHGFTTLAEIRDDVDIRWTNNTKETTGTSTNDASTNDTVIYYTNGTDSDTSDDEIVMVLEDYTTDLTFTDFDLV